MAFDKKKLGFIINPKAGTYKIKHLEEIINSTIDTSLYTITLVKTNYAGEATLMAKKMAEENYFAVVAIGGDGTANEVGQALLYSNTHLAIIPKGSGNGLARVLGIPLAIKQALAIINKGKTKNIDTGKANDSIFLNNCGVGLDAYISQTIQEQSKRGFYMYAKKVFSAFKKYIPEYYSITWSTGNLNNIRAYLISIANGHEFGYGFKISPTATIHDGKLDIMIISPTRYLQTLDMLLSLKLGRIHTHQKVKHIISEYCIITNPNCTVFQVDGDVKKCNGSLTIQVQPNSLSIIVP